MEQQQQVNKKSIIPGMMEPTIKLDNVKKTSPSHTFISGGQLGADLGALKAAKKLGYGTTGYMPKGFLTEAGARKDIATDYGLKESDGSWSERDKQNVDMCDFLIAFMLTKPLTGRGSNKTINYAVTGKYEENDLFYETNPYCEYKVLFSPPSSIKRSKEIAEVLGKVLPQRIPNEIKPKPPVLVFYNPEEHEGEVASMIQRQCWGYENIMISGSCESTCEGIGKTVKKILMRAFAPLQWANLVRPAKK